MMDGAMTIGSEAAAHIIWRSPQEVFEERLKRMIAERLYWNPDPGNSGK